MKNIFLLAVLIFGAQSFAAEKKDGDIGEIKRSPCGLLGLKDERCKDSPIDEYGSNKDVNCGMILSHTQCNALPTDSTAFDICCRIPAQGKITKCKMTPDKQMLFCEDSKSKEELVYIQISNQGHIPVANPIYPSRQMGKTLEQEVQKGKNSVDNQR